MCSPLSLMRDAENIGIALSLRQPPMMNSDVNLKTNLNFSYSNFWSIQHRSTVHCTLCLFIMLFFFSTKSKSKRVIWIVLCSVNIDGCDQLAFASIHHSTITSVRMTLGLRLYETLVLSLRNWGWPPTWVYFPTYLLWALAWSMVM